MKETKKLSVYLNRGDKEIGVTFDGEEMLFEIGDRPILLDDEDLDNLVELFTAAKTHLEARPDSSEELTELIRAYDDQVNTCPDCSDSYGGYHDKDCRVRKHLAAERQVDPNEKPEPDEETES